MKMERVTTPLAYSTSGSLVVFGFTLSDLSLIVGILLGIATFMLNWYYKAKDDKRKEQAASFSISPLD